MASYFEPLIMASIGTASKILDSQQQMNLLDQTKTLAESALQMLYTAKEAGGNPKVSTACSVAVRTLIPLKTYTLTVNPLLRTCVLAVVKRIWPNVLCFWRQYNHK